jgi:hypothetical protein
MLGADGIRPGLPIASGRVPQALTIVTDVDIEGHYKVNDLVLLLVWQLTHGP